MASILACSLSRYSRFAPSMSSIGLFWGEVEAGLAIAGCGDEDAFAGAFVLQCSEQVPDCGDPDGVLITLGLDNYFAAEDRPGVPGDAVHASIS